LDVQDFSGADLAFLFLIQNCNVALQACYAPILVPFAMICAFSYAAVIQVEPWQEVQQELTGKHEAVARVCVVLGNGIRLFYKYDHSRKAFSEYGKHSPPVLDRNDDAPCCFFNGRFVRVNRDTSRSPSH
jgi:hypothetical protein